MANVSYGYAATTAEFKVNIGPDPTDQTDPDMSLFDGGSAIITFTTVDSAVGTGRDFAHRTVGLNGTGGLQTVAFPAPTGAQDNLVVDVLSNGDFVTAGRDAVAPGGAGSGSIVWAVEDLPDEAAPKIAGNQSDDQVGPDIAALTGDRFVIVWTDELNGSSSNTDIRMSVFNNAGTVTVKNSTAVANPAGVQRGASVAALTTGGFVVSWSDDGADAAKTRIVARRYDSDGNGVGSSIIVDDVGDNDTSKIIGLSGGGFAVVHRGNQYGSASDISMRIFNADGTAKTDVLAVATAANIEGEPVIAQLSNGFLTVSWTRNVSGLNNDLYMRTFTADGNAVTEAFRYQGTDVDSFNERQSTIAATGDGRVALAWTDGQVLDNGGTHIGAAVYAVRRTTNGDAADETLTGDSLQDIIFGLGGQDVIAGGPGDDQLFGGTGDDAMRGGVGADVIDGGAGNDTADYGDMIAPIAVTLTGATDAIVQVGLGPLSRDTIRNVENVTGGEGADTIVGDGFANILKGGLGKDFLHANSYNLDGTIKPLASSDTLEGGDGDDGLFAGDGHDTLKGGDGDDGMVGGAGNDAMEGGLGIDFLFGGAFAPGGAQLAGSGHDTLNGGDDKDGLYGFDGNDLINGDAGDDYIEGARASTRSMAAPAMISCSARATTTRSMAEPDSIMSMAALAPIFSSSGRATQPTGFSTSRRPRTTS